MPHGSYGPGSFSSFKTKLEISIQIASYMQIQESTRAIYIGKVRGKKILY